MENKHHFVDPIWSFWFWLDNVRNCNTGQILSWNIIWYPDSLKAQTFPRPCWQLNYSKEYLIRLNTSCPKLLGILLESLSSVRPGRRCESVHGHNVEMQGSHFPLQRESAWNSLKWHFSTSDFEKWYDSQNSFLCFLGMEFRFSHDEIWYVDSHLTFSSRRFSEMGGLKS